jgi:hypothetical protein
MTRGGMLASSAVPMSLHFPPRLLLPIASFTLTLMLGGCASKEERMAQRKWETQDERTTREVFKKDWLLPSVSEDEKDFFYRTWLRNSDY